MLPLLLPLLSCFVLRGCCMCFPFSHLLQKLMPSVVPTNVISSRLGNRWKHWRHLCQKVRIVVPKSFSPALTQLSSVPGKRYALTLQLMLKRSMKRKPSTVPRSPQLPRESYPPKVPSERPSSMAVNQVVNPTPISPSVFDPSLVHQSLPGYPPGYVTDVNNIWRGFEATSAEQLPVWLSDQSLGGSSFSQSGIDAFLLPPDYLPPAPQIW